MKPILVFALFSALSADLLLAGAKFINADTLRVTATGKARKTDSNLRDQTHCKEAALIEAQRIAIETLVDMNWPNVKGKVSREKYGAKIIQTTTGTIKGGRITSSTVDGSANPMTCTITMEIHRINPRVIHERTMQSLELNDHP